MECFRCELIHILGNRVPLADNDDGVLLPDPFANHDPGPGLECNPTNDEPEDFFMHK